MVSVWRVHIRPTGGIQGVDFEWSYDLCQRRSVIGIGWRVTESYSPNPMTLGDYMARVDPQDYSWNQAIRRLANMAQHDLVWTRSPKPHHYHLSRIVGPWDYRDSFEYRVADIVNVRPVETIEIDPQSISANLAGRFAGGHTIDPIRDQELVDLTTALWEKAHVDRVSDQVSS